MMNGMGCPGMMSGGYGGTLVAVLWILLMLSAITALMALTVFLVRKGRAA